MRTVRTKRAPKTFLQQEEYYTRKYIDGSLKWGKLYIQDMEIEHIENSIALIKKKNKITIRDVVFKRILDQELNKKKRFKELGL